MDLVTVAEVRQESLLELRDSDWREGDAWLGGGTWLFSEPQTHLRRLRDLRTLEWPSLTVTDAGLEIAATCTINELEKFVAPPEWKAAHLFAECAHCLLASFKIYKTATVGGNVCMSLPAGAMISLTSSLEGICTIQPADGGVTKLPVVDFVTGDHENVLKPGDLLRSITLPASALRKRASFRRMSLTHIGRSTALVIGTICPESGEFVLTITAATYHPVQLRFDRLPSADELRARLIADIPDSVYFADVHGTPEYRKHMTFYYAEQLREELASGDRS